jgi:phosphate-selective porin OprO/OprP
MSNIALTATVLSVAWCGQAWADETSEKALKDQVEALKRQVDDLTKRIGDGSSRSNDELEMRIADLEKVTYKDKDGMFARWSNGLRMDTVDGAFSFKIFGRIQQDFYGWRSEDEVTEALGDTIGGSDFRRARLGVSGKIYKNIEFKAEYDFAGGSANFQDVYMQLNDALCGGGGIPPVQVRVGHFDEPFGLDRLTSSKYTTFTERSFCEVFAPQRNSGIMVLGQALESRLAWFLGYFRDADNFGNDNGNAQYGEHNITARVAGRPWVNEEGTSWVHLGGAISRRQPSNENVRYSARPEIRQGPLFVDTGTIPGNTDALLFDLEAAANFGPFHAQVEYVQSELHGSDYGVNLSSEDHTFSAASAQAGFFITGENREYDAVGARWDRVKVKRNYGKEGWGALEVALRYSIIDLNDGDIDSVQDPSDSSLSAGGEMSDWTFAINWYLNPHTRVMFDVVRADRDDLPEIWAGVVSFRIDF